MSDQPPQPTRLLDQVRTAIRMRRMSYRTEQTYCEWIKRFILFHKKRHPKEMGAPEIEAFLADLVNNRKVAASTQNQALHSILFLYREVLMIELPRIGLMPVKSRLACRWSSRRKKFKKPASPSTDVATPFAIASPRICWNPVMTVARCRNYSATRMLVLL